MLRLHGAQWNQPVDPTVTMDDIMPKYKQGQDCPRCGGTNPNCAYGAKFGEIPMVSETCKAPEPSQVSYVRSCQAQINHTLDEINAATSDLEKRIGAVLLPSRPTDTPAREEEKAVQCEVSNLADELGAVKSRLHDHLCFINNLRERVDL